MRFGRIDVTEAQFSIIAIHLVSAVLGPEIWLTKMPYLECETRCLPFYMASGVDFSLSILNEGCGKNGSSVAIAHMTKAEMEYLDWSLLGPALLFLNQYFNCIVPEIWLLWFTLAWGTQDLLRYCAQVCLEICQHLRIDLFRIPYGPKVLNTSSVGSQSNVGADKNGGTSHRKSKSKAH
ncbi:cholinephosphotransferase 1-like isoform X1 [Drosophila novamexicana]|uniref:cholinephosphotransferase 1-like isoform X3 n=1 Tax=Drosophila novamexicana TaxID=47314 RepID=UPI0011E5EED0|nr:cholinephosphotransferase 1-like isoform X3 [Drosophila novamexicana]XP_030557661.1 cholinephosphotransferase 1-like isoform X1 [Drosophila novamexicana]